MSSVLKGNFALIYTTHIMRSAYLQTPIITKTRLVLSEMAQWIARRPAWARINLIAFAMHRLNQTCLCPCQCVSAEQCYLLRTMHFQLQFVSTFRREFLANVLLLRRLKFGVEGMSTAEELLPAAGLSKRASEVYW